MYIKRTGRLMINAVSILLLAAGCGGGSGDGNPPPPPTGVSYTVQLTSVSLVDTRAGVDVDSSGLPITGATATRQP
ncbi:MAG: hypothetical protein GXP15_08040 [Gammaproteobacteria bacterium]|nr:hypothetical protein [Gammaproteobacteria bacterium]